MRNQIVKFIFVVSIASNVNFPCLAGESYHASEASTEADSEASYGASSESSHMPASQSAQENSAEAAGHASSESHWSAPPAGGYDNMAPQVNMNIQEQLGLNAKNVSVSNREGTVVADHFSSSDFILARVFVGVSFHENGSKFVCGILSPFAQLAAEIF